jgi:hypothetical protein
MDGLLSMFEEQFKKGEPYRDAFRGLLRGDTSGWNKLNAPSLADPQEAVDIATGFAGTIKPVQRKVFEEAFNLAQQRAALPVSEGGLGLPATNTAMDRASAMGYTTPAYHGTSENIEQFIPSKKGRFGPGIYTSKNPNRASGFIKSEENANVIPLLLNNPDLSYFNGEIYLNSKPNSVRSINAAFDPFRRNEPDILAGVAAAPAGLLAIDKEKPKKKRSNK